MGKSTLTPHSHLVYAVPPSYLPALADELQWVLQLHGVSCVGHYLDNFFTLGPPNSDQCFKNLHIISETCKELGIPLAPHKSIGPTTCLVILGIVIDTVARELGLPPDKLTRLKNLAE